MRPVTNELARLFELANAANDDHAAPQLLHLPHTRRLLRTRVMVRKVDDEKEGA